MACWRRGDAERGSRGVPVEGAQAAGLRRVLERCAGAGGRNSPGRGGRARLPPDLGRRRSVPGLLHEHRARARGRLVLPSGAARGTHAGRGVYVGAWRGIDFLLGRPEVDPERIGVTGSSQGGGLTVTTAAMRSEVRAAAAGAPYLCGFVDAIELTHTYPYEEINDYVR